MAATYIMQCVIRIAERIRDIATDEVPYITGDLRKSLHVQALSGESASVGSNLIYAKWVHEGTGLFGPHKQYIYPTKKQALFWPGAAHPVKRVAGQKPNPFLTRAATRAAKDIPMIAPLLAEEISKRITDCLSNVTIEMEV